MFQNSPFHNFVMHILTQKHTVDSAIFRLCQRTIINLFRAAQHISDNFIKSSEVATKRTILKSIFRTLQLKDTTLCYDLNFPFNVLYKNTENNKWRRRRDYFAGAASPGKICAFAQTGVRPSAFLRRFEPFTPGSNPHYKSQ